MNVTESRFKNRQLHMEDYLQMVSAEQKEYAEVFDYSKIAEKSGVITDYWTNNLLDLILRKGNLNNAYKQVKKNKGKGGIDGMQVDELLPFLRENQDSLIQEIREGKYKPNPVRRVEIPKETKGEFRKLGVPTVVDRVIQQAIAQELSPIYEEQFSENSFGFRPKRGAHDALRQCQKNVNDGYVYVVDMDLEKFFDTVCQNKLIEVLSRTIKDGRVISLIHKYLNAGVIAKGMFERTEVGMPQGGPLSPLLSNVMLNELDKELENRGHRFVRYADDCMIFCKSRKSAERTLKNIIPFIEKKLFLKVNRKKTEVAHISTVKYLGYSFYRHKGKCRFRVHPKSVAKMKNRIRELALAIIMGGLFGLLHAVLCIKYHTNQAVSGVGINIFASGLTLVLCKVIWNKEGLSEEVAQIPTITIPGLSKIPVLGALFTNQSPYLYITLFIVFISWYIMFKTKAGLRLRTIGDHPKAAATAGVNVKKYRYVSVISCGMLCGLAGSYLSIVQSNLFVKEMVAGRGYIALAATIFGGWNPLGSFFASLLFAFSQAIRIIMEFDIPEQFLQMLPYVLTMIVLVLAGGKSKGPQASGDIKD